MNTIVNIYSDKIGEISRFLSSFYKKNIFLSNDLKWEKIFENPIEIADIIGTFIDNKDAYKINMWISLDKNVFIKVDKKNADKIIRYLYERFPY